MKNNTFFIIILSIFCVLNFSHQPPVQLDTAALRLEYQEKLAKYLAKKSDVYNHISIDEDGIHIYKNVADKQRRKSEFVLFWTDLDRFQYLLKVNPNQAYSYYRTDTLLPQHLNYDAANPSMPFEPDSLQPLKGLKIALDAGHIAGDIETAKLEGKYIDMFYQGKQRTLFEADLAWYTSKVLEEKLTALGAKVFLTRETYGTTAFDNTYDDWYARYDTVPKPTKSRLFWRYFRHIDNDERIRKVNRFQPDLTLIMHYNVDGNNEPWKKPCNKQYSMAFVGGSYLSGELFEPERRFNLLRLLVTQSIEQSAEFSNQILEAVDKQAGVPRLPLPSNQRYVSAIGILVKYQGVYARNLALSGRIYGTLCYAEPLFQDHFEEVIKLSDRNYDFHGTMIPTRVVEIADAYLTGILAYAKTLN